MKISYVVSMTAQELKAVEAIMAEVKPSFKLQKGEMTFSQKSRLEYTLVKFKLKRTLKMEVSMEVSEEYLQWAADTVTRMAPLIRGLVPQFQNLQDEALKAVLAIPEDDDAVFESSES